MTARFDSPCGAQVLDGCAVHSAEGGDVAFAGVPVERERMVLSVERAGILMVISAYHRDISSEVDVGFELGVEIGPSLFVDNLTERFPLVGVLDEHRAVLVRAHHDDVVLQRRRLVLIVFFLLQGDGDLASRTAELEPRLIVVKDIGVGAGNAESSIPVVKIVTTLCGLLFEIGMYAESIA